MHFRQMKGYAWFKRVVRIIGSVQFTFAGDTHVHEDKEDRRIASIGEIIRAKAAKMAPGETRSRVDAFLQGLPERK